MTKDILQQRITKIEQRIADAAARSGRRREDITLVAVSKTVTPEVAALVYELGIRDFGESRPQELWKKHAALPAANWHLIGHLQRNKIDKTIPLVKLVHSVDSERLIAALDEFGQKAGLRIPILLELNCSREASKGGIMPEEAWKMAVGVTSTKAVWLEGLMTMAAHHDNPEQCRSTFRELREIREDLRRKMGIPLPYLSMGMSNDFEIAIEEGATHVRIGSTLFAEE